MTERHEDHELEADPALDALLRQAGGTSSAARLPLDENELLAYLDGELAEDRAEEAREALAASPALRRELMAIVADQRDLHDVLGPAAASPRAETAEDPWAHVRRRRSEPRWTSSNWIDGLRSLFRKPAFAYTFMLLLLAYPAYRLVRGGGDAQGPLIQTVRAVNLDAGGVIVRGEEEAALPRIVSDPDAPLLLLTLWSQRPYQTDQRIRVAVLVDDAQVWLDEDLSPRIDPDDPYRLDLRLSVGALDRGQVVIAVTRVDGGDGSEILEERYRFVLE